ncbi:hypothetical protein [Streptomyces sp. NPDC047869]|uniref:hypothetical protein n=1 Tax=Streptomyces sp. NPDC047869 TaxID=3154709 RepID=UPI003453452C
MKLDLGLTTCGVMIHALRGDREAVQLLLETLTPDQLATVAEHALMGLAEAVTTTHSTRAAEQIALGMQDKIFESGGNLT